MKNLITNEIYNCLKPDFGDAVWQLQECSLLWKLTSSLHTNENNSCVHLSVPV